MAWKFYEKNKTYYGRNFVEILVKLTEKNIYYSKKNYIIKHIIINHKIKEKNKNKNKKYSKYKRYMKNLFITKKGLFENKI